MTTFWFVIKKKNICSNSNRVQARACYSYKKELGTENKCLLRAQRSDCAVSATGKQVHSDHAQFCHYTFYNFPTVCRGKFPHFIAGKFTTLSNNWYHCYNNIFHVIKLITYHINLKFQLNINITIFCRFWVLVGINVRVGNK